MIEIDHVILAVPSLDAALEKLKRDHGLLGIPTPPDGGPIETAIIPFENDQYLEVLALKESEASSGPLIDFAEQLQTRGAFFWGFAVWTTDIESVASRVGIPATTFSGQSVQSKTIRPPTNEANQLPFFIEYLNRSGQAYLAKIRSESQHTHDGLRFSRIAVSTNRMRLTEWLGVDPAKLEGVDATSEVDSADHTGGIASVEIETRSGRIELFANT